MAHDFDAGSPAFSRPHRHAAAASRSTRLAPLAGLCAAMAMTAFAGAAQAQYFVRPYIGHGAGVIDGIEVNGATSSSQNFTSSLQSHVDLSEGTVRSFVEVTGGGGGGSSYGQAAGIFGDRLHFHGAEGTQIQFDFDFDGTVLAPALDPNLNSFGQIFITANFYVFEAGSGAAWNNFTSHGGALIAQSDLIQYTNWVEDIDDFVARNLSGSILASGPAAYDVFASLAVSTSLNSNPVTVTLDFMNTGRFGLQVADGVTYSSASGVFPGGVAAAVPEPAAWTMMIAGFGLAGAALRRSRRPALATAGAR